MNRSSVGSHIRNVCLLTTLAVCALTLALPASAQQQAAQKAQAAVLRGEAAREFARDHNWPVRIDRGAGLMELYTIVDGFPRYRITDNADAADSVSTDEVLPGGSTGLNLTGAGVTLGVWDGGGVRTTHQEYGGRATQMDSPGATHYHSTHVAGTMIASGVVAAAKGMSPAATLHCWDWDNDTSEMRSAASSGLLVSSHSYGLVHGWYYDYFGDGNWVWFGDTRVSTTEDYNFGLYTSDTEDYDDVAWDYPYLLICKSAGNDRNDDGPGAGGGHWYPNYSDGYWDWSTATRDPDGDYDCIGTVGVAKNILTVAAVEDVNGGYAGPGSVIMSSFSAFGPTDDGRIKPDIAANGVGLYSTFDDSDSAYYSISGTSMSTPNASGSMGVLIQYWRNTHPGQGDMRSATLKGLVLHTADECGEYNGPDYEFGWGLLNTKTAAETITQDVSIPLTISEQTINSGETFTVYATTDGTSSQLRASICWTDRAGTPPGNVLNPSTPMLVNDLDLRIIRSSTTYYPWVLNRNNPSAAATTGDNSVDNVEQVVVYSPGSNTYTIQVTPSGSLAGGSQAYSLIITGAAAISTSPGGYTLNVTTSGSGTVDLDPAGGVYSAGTTVELTANPSTGWSFDSWSGDLNSSDNPETIYMNSNKSVTANFTQDSYTLTVNVVGGGGVTLDPPGGTYLSGTTVTLTADANSGWAFSTWSGDLAGSTNPDSIVMDGPKTVTATFVEFTDCNGNGVQDATDIANGTSVDCNDNGVPDECDVDGGGSDDCDGNGVPDECQNDLVGGLAGAYYNTIDLSGTPMGRVDSTIDFDWGNGSPWNGFNSDDFSVRWTGYVVTASVSGTYTFYTTTDDGVRLYVDEQLLIDEWSDQAATEYSGTINLQANREYTIVMEYYENGGQAVAELRWQPPSMSKVIIPSSNLIPGRDCNSNGTLDMCDVASGADDVNGNGIPDECDPHYTLAVSTSGSGSVGLDPTGGYYLEGTAVELTASADTDWYFDGWSGDLIGSTNPETIVMDADMSVTATFLQEEYTLTVNVSGNGLVDLDPAGGSYAYGTTVDLTANADAGWAFDHWEGDLNGSTNPESLYMDGAKTVTAVFTQDAYSLTVNITGNGSVDLDPAGGSYAYGDTVELTANADVGWAFDHWEGDLNGSTNPESLYMDGPKTVTAVFTQDAYSLTVNITGNGSVDLDPAGGSYAYGETVELTANADAGWSFDHWEGDLNGSINPESLYMDGPKTVTAVFVEDVVCLGDLDGDFDVDLSDLQLLLSNYGSTSALPEDGDLDGDGDVDLADLQRLLSMYGTVC